jgi:hypothetical protein
MLPMILSTETLASFTLSDATLEGFRWEQGGRDIALDLVLGDGTPAVLRCTWAGSVRVTLASEANDSCHALSWECQCFRVGERWRLDLQFPPHGSIELECQEARLEYGTEQQAQRTP